MKTWQKVSLGVGGAVVIGGIVLFSINQANKGVVTVQSAKVASQENLVSVVTGQLQAQYNAMDLLRATFPGGSITGAPKIRAMEIIAEIEPTQRGPYCGSVLYLFLPLIYKWILRFQRQQ